MREVMWRRWGTAAPVAALALGEDNEDAPPHFTQGMQGELTVS